jgi:hypothetical protein
MIASIVCVRRAELLLPGAIERLEHVGWFNTPLVYVYCHKVIPTDSIGLHWPIVRIKFNCLSPSPLKGVTDNYN